MGKRHEKDRSRGRKICCCLTILSLLGIAGTLTWYFVFFAKDVEVIIGDCGGCHCIPDATTNFACPSSGSNDDNNGVQPTLASYPEAHLNAWKSPTLLNPYVLNCNPYKDGVFCDTEPPLDPEYEWFKLGEIAVCAIHYEREESEGLVGLETFGGKRRLLKKPSAIGENYLGDAENSTLSEEDLDELFVDGRSEELAEDNDGIKSLAFENEQCENTAFYRIKTYPSREAAELAGGFVTHVGNCGVCSSLQDLAVYANEDFIGQTSAGNFCRRQAATSFENGLSCYRGLGMTQDCAKIWADTSWNTARNCFGSCVLKSSLPQIGGGGNDIGDGLDTNSTKTESSNKWYDLPATLRKRFTNRTKEEREEKEAKAVPSNGPAPECALNGCITCNDENSAPTFERFAGRSRRRSGLLSTAARPCGSLPNIIQNPCPATEPLRE